MRDPTRLDRLSRLLLDLQRAAGQHAAEDFCDQALDRLKQDLPFDSAFWASGYHVAGQGPVLHTVHLHRQPVQMMVDYQAIGPLDPVLAAVLQQPGVPLAADSASWAAPQALPFLQRYRIAHTLATCAVDPRTALVTGISLYRADAACPFGEPERLWMQAAFAHLLEARTHNRLQHLVAASSPRQAGPWRPAACDAMGLLHHADGAFTQLLLQEWPDWTGPTLPAPLRQAAGRGGARRWAGQRLVCKLTPLAELVLVQLRPATAVDRLTPREKEVATYTAQGLTHKEIARLMDLAPATVRTHLSSSCRRLGVKSKTQLAAMVAGAE